MKTETKIKSNGSKWYGEQPDSIEKLLEVLETEPLDKSFERYGNFYEPTEGISGSINFFGNFFTVSHVFNIDTNDIKLIKKLANAIENNKKRADYISQDRPEEIKAFFAD